MLLEAWWPRTGSRVSHGPLENHKRNGSHGSCQRRTSIPVMIGRQGNRRKNTSLLLNRVIQEFGRTGEMNHGMFHTILQRFFDSWRLPADNCSKFHAKFSQAGYALGDGFRNRLQGVTSWPRPNQTGRDGDLHSDSLRFCLLLALHAGDRAPGRATELSDNPSFWSSGRSLTKRS